MADRRLFNAIALPALWRGAVAANAKAAHRLISRSLTALPVGAVTLAGLRRFLPSRRMLTGAGLLTVALASLVFLTALSMTGRAPTWWRTIDPASPVTLQIGTDLENALVDELSRVRPAAAGHASSPAGAWQSDDWGFSIPASDANAWLNARLPKWLANRTEPINLPQDLTQLQVEFDSGLVHIGAMVRQGDTSRILSATLQPRLEPDGSLWFTATWLHAGRLPVPASWVVQRAADPRSSYIPEKIRRLPETAAMLRAFAGEIPIIQTPVVKLGDGRRVRLLSLAARNGRLEIRCRTEKRLATDQR